MANKDEFLRAEASMVKVLQSLTLLVAVSHLEQHQKGKKQL